MCPCLLPLVSFNNFKTVSILPTWSVFLLVICQNPVTILWTHHKRNSIYVQNILMFFFKNYNDWSIVIFWGIIKNFPVETAGASKNSLLLSIWRLNEIPPPPPPLSPHHTHTHAHKYKQMQLTSIQISIKNIPWPMEKVNC